MRDQPKWEGKQACPVCGRVTYSFLHSCPGVPQRPSRHQAHSESDDEFWGRLLGADDPCAPGKDWAAAAFGGDMQPNGRDESDESVRRHKPIPGAPSAGECVDCYGGEGVCDECPAGEDPACAHDWLDRPESDTRECLICGAEVSG